MQQFKSYITESVLHKIEIQLMKLGYNKFKQKTRNTLLVYVPKSDRDLALADIAKKLKGELDKSPTTMRRISSAGAVLLPNGLYIGVKPDLTKGLKTDEQETLAGIFIATYLQNKKTTFSLEDLSKGERDVRSAHKINTLYPKAGRGWIESSTTIAKALGPYLAATKYEVHQRSGSKFEKNISDAAKRLLKDAGHKMGLDKWNPADIWIIKPKFANTNFKQFSDIVELNNWLLERFAAKDILGVSLKQVGKTAKVQVFNKDKPKPLKYEGWDVGKTGFVRALNGTIFFSGQSMIIRNFGRPESVSGEINGKLAQGGKVGHGALVSIWTKYDRSFEVMKHQVISTMYEKDPDKAYNILFDCMKELDPESITKYNDVTELKDAIEAKNNTLNYIISKIQVSTFIKSLNKMSNKDKDDLVGALVAYAASSTEVSSVFYKVS